jgi:hypothetical protein
MGTDALDAFIGGFARAKASFELLRVGDGLICKQGAYERCLVLKLQKAAWTNDSMEQLENESGVFFSIWIDEEAAGQGRALYNIHALKMRHLKGYTIQSRAFAAAFRRKFASIVSYWPNVRTDYGPLTLMQGWIATSPESFETDALLLMRRLGDVYPLIDGLLDECRDR